MIRFKKVIVWIVLLLIFMQCGGKSSQNKKKKIISRDKYFKIKEEFEYKRPMWGYNPDTGEIADINYYNEMKRQFFKKYGIDEAEFILAGKLYESKTNTKKTTLNTKLYFKIKNQLENGMDSSSIKERFGISLKEYKHFEKEHWDELKKYINIFERLKSPLQPINNINKLTIKQYIEIYFRLNEAMKVWELDAPEGEREREAYMKRKKEEFFGKIGITESEFNDYSIRNNSKIQSYTKNHPEILKRFEEIPTGDVF